MRLNQITEAPQPAVNDKAAKENIKKQIQELEKQINTLEIYKIKVRQITKEIKYDDTVNNIVFKVGELAKKARISERTIEYKNSEIFQAQSNLESAVYGLEEEFTEAISQLEYQIESLQDQLDFPNA